MVFFIWASEIIGFKNCTFKSLIAWGHITLSVIMLLSIVLILVFGSDYRFFIDWITHNPFRCMAWNETDTNISGRLSSSKTHPPLPLLVGEILRFVYVFAGWLYVYVSVCSSGWSARKSPFHAQRLVNTFGESAGLEVGETDFLILSVTVVLTSCVVVNLQFLEVLSHLAVWIFNFDG